MEGREGLWFGVAGLHYCNMKRIVGVARPWGELVVASRGVKIFDECLQFSPIAMLEYVVRR